MRRLVVVLAATVDILQLLGCAWQNERLSNCLMAGITEDQIESQPGFYAEAWPGRLKACD